MRIHNLYVDPNGETHFRDIDVEWKNEGRGGKTSATLPATGIIFRETPGTYDYEWHPAPRRQYIINLDGAVSIQATCRCSSPKLRCSSSTMSGANAICTRAA